MEHGEARCMICWNGWRILLNTCPTKKLQCQAMHPQAFLVNSSSGTIDESSIGQEQHFYSLPEGPKLRSAQEDQHYKGLCRKRTGTVVP